MTQPAASELLVGSVLRDTYEITSLLGKGGMGAVYLARHRRLIGKNVAVKVLLGGANIPPEIYARFRREAEITSQLGHPNIVEMLDFDTMEDGTPFLVMEYLRGESLEQRLERGPLSVQEMTSLTRQIGSALGAAHRVGVVHRDLKPANVFLVPTDSGGVVGERVKLLDFGISKMLDSKTLQTQEAVLMGTPQYMAPEQALGKNSEVDARTDLFALGCIVYEMLSGRSPFAAEGSTLVQVVFRIVHARPEPLASLCPGLPEHVVSAVERAMEKTSADRPSNVAAFISELTGVPMMSLSNQPMPLVTTPSRRDLSAVGPVNTGRFGLEDDLGSTHVPAAAAPSSTARFSLPGDDGGFAATHMPGSTPAPLAPAGDGGFAATHMPGSPVSPPAPVSHAGTAVPAPMTSVPSAPVPSPPVPERRRAVSRWAVGGGWAVVVVGVLAAGAWWMRPPPPAPSVPVESPPVAAAPPEPTAPPVPREPPPEAPSVPPVSPPTGASTTSAPPQVAAAPPKGPRVQRPSASKETEVVPEEVSQLLKDAKAALKAGQSGEAASLADKAVRLYPSGESYALRIRAYCLVGDLGGVNRVLRQAKGLLTTEQKREARQFCRAQDLKF